MHVFCVCACVERERDTDCVSAFVIVYDLYTQIHQLDAETWKTVDVVLIDIADKTQVEAAVSQHHFSHLCPLPDHQYPIMSTLTLFPDIYPITSSIYPLYLHLSPLMSHI